MRQEISAPSAPEVRCAECGEIANGPADGWKAYLAGGFEAEPVEIVVFCPTCAYLESAPDAA